MACSSRIIRERQLAIRREMDRRHIALKIVAQDSGIPLPTLATYFPADQSKEPAQIPGGAIYALCEALPADLLSLLLPEGFQIVRADEQIDHDTLAGLAEDYVSTKMAAHHHESEAGRELGPGELAVLGGKVTALRAAA